jgi:NAD+ synthase
LNQNIIDEIKNQDYNTIIETIEDFLEEQIGKTQSKGVILGLSGGIDSAVIAYI